MGGSSGKLLLRIAGGLLALTGFLAWVVLAWRGLANLDTIDAEGAEGQDFMTWALIGTTLMIGGMILLHFAESVAEREAKPERPAR